MSGFRVEIAAEALEVGTEQHDIAAQVLLIQASIWVCRRKTTGALEVNLLEARQSFVLPVQQRSGWHSSLSPRPTFSSSDIFPALSTTTIEGTPKLGNGIRHPGCRADKTPIPEFPPPTRPEESQQGEWSSRELQSSR